MSSVSVSSRQGGVQGRLRSRGHNACMEPNQTRIIELLREVHLLAIKEVERLNLRVAELENQQRLSPEQVIFKTSVKEPLGTAIKAPVRPELPEILNERQVAEYLKMSLACAVGDSCARGQST